MEKSNLLCFCLPTCNVESINKYLIPSLKNLGSLKDYCCISITFQPPYTENDIEDIIKKLNSLNLNYKYEYKEYKFDYGKTPLNKMRQDCALRYPNALFYGLLDDDMTLLEGIDKQYLDILYLMLANRKLSVCSIANNMQILEHDRKYLDDATYLKLKYNYNIALTDINRETFFTKAGLIYRGGYFYNFKGLIPEDMVSLIGGRQDVTMAIYRFLKGDSAISCSNGKCLHYEYRKVPGFNKYNWLVEADKDKKLISNTDWLNANGYIRHNLIGTNSILKNFSDNSFSNLLDKGIKTPAINMIYNFINQDTFSLEEIINNINKIMSSETFNDNQVYLTFSESDNNCSLDYKVIYSGNIFEYVTNKNKYFIYLNKYKINDEMSDIYSITITTKLNDGNAIYITINNSFLINTNSKDLKDFLNNIDIWKDIYPIYKNIYNYMKNSNSDMK